MAVKEEGTARNTQIESISSTGGGRGGAGFPNGFGILVGLKLDRVMRREDSTDPAFTSRQQHPTCHHPPNQLIS